MPHVARSAHRLDALDMVRGIAMLLMAIDHVRVYAGVPPGGPEPGVFFTRWVTHFVAPAFVFLAGTAAYLHGRRYATSGPLARFLVTRGIWLVLLELTVLRVAWTFNLRFDEYLLAGVIWMLGWCMVALAGVVWFPLRLIGTLGVLIVAGHNLVDRFPGLSANEPSWFLKVLYFGGVVPLGAEGPPLFVLFVILPWLGLMLCGYAFGTVMEWGRDRRPSFCLWLGLGLSVAFVAVRAVDGYGDPRPWHGSQLPPVLAFLNTSKYPASLCFLLMTCGPMLVTLAAAERWRGRVADMLVTFGRVPLFYYLLHIPVIHLAAMVVSILREGHVNPWLYGHHPMNPPPVPEGYRWSLGLLYLVTVLCLGLLYVPCRWYALQKRAHPRGWMSYV